VIHSPLKESAGSPIQSASAKNVKGRIEVFPPYVRGLRDVAGFSHLILIYDFHMARKFSLTVRPFLDNKNDRGIFSTRSPARPNPIGISTVRIKSIRGGSIFVQDLDMIDGTPLLDIKPYVPAFDHREVKRIGWYAGRLYKLTSIKADNRFSR
jgi:tRNA-Thr(GGU) m(6)t(6)A37 methyltransferase TsaA